jgi:hypothetical protein
MDRDTFASLEELDGYINLYSRKVGFTLATSKSYNESDDGIRYVIRGKYKCRAMQNGSRCPFIVYFTSTLAPGASIPNLYRFSAKTLEHNHELSPCNSEPDIVVTFKDKADQLTDSEIKFIKVHMDMPPMAIARLMHNEFDLR